MFETAQTKLWEAPSGRHYRVYSDAIDDDSAAELVGVASTLASRGTPRGAPLILVPGEMLGPVGES